MRIKNKYLRNRAFRVKHWKRIRSQEQPYKTFCPYRIDIALQTYWVRYWDEEQQIKSHFEWIDKRARAIENGTHKHWNHASSNFRRRRNIQLRSKERAALEKVRGGNYDIEFPKFKRDADWFFNLDNL